MTDMTRFTKGHGTENDFVLVPDLEGSLELTPAQVQRIADRHAGLGADGVIRVVRTALSTDEAVRAQSREAEWFMDYRNADGSLAEMCGNGTRVFADYLRREGLAFGSTFTIATRAGVKTVRVVDEGYAVDLGPWRLGDEEAARRDGFDVMVRPHHGKPVPALTLDLGNPHAVVMLPEGISLENLDLAEAPELHPEPADGSNVEFVRAVGPGHIAMRVHERVSPTPRSCTRMAMCPGPSARTNSTLAPPAGSGCSSGASVRSRFSRAMPSGSMTTACGLPRSSDSAGTGLPWRGFTMTSKPSRRAPSSSTSRHGPRSTAYPVSVMRTFLTPARVAMLKELPKTRPSRRRKAAKTRVPLPHISASEPSPLR